MKPPFWKGVITAIHLWVGMIIVAAFPSTALADVSGVVEKMLRNIYPDGKTSFHAGLRVCDILDKICISDQVNQYDRKVKIYLGKIRTEQSREHSTLVDVYFPQRQKKTILHDGNKLYLLLPTTKNPIRIPPQQTLLGDVDVGTILDIDYLAYKARELTRGSNVVKVEFYDPVGRHQFPRIILDISLATYSPTSGEFYSSSGALIRRAEYHNVGELGTRRTFRRVVADSLLSKNSTVTLIDYLAEEGVHVPDALFRKSGMTKFRSKY